MLSLGPRVEFSARKEGLKAHKAAVDCSFLTPDSRPWNLSIVRDASPTTHARSYHCKLEFEISTDVVLVHAALIICATLLDKGADWPYVVPDLTSALLVFAGTPERPALKQHTFSSIYLSQCAASY